MKIAILAWSQLAANPGWQADGPLLPIEFARTSEGSLIQVLCGEPWVLKVRTLWIASTFDDLEQARNDWAPREGVLPAEIGYVRLVANDPHPEQLNALVDVNLRNEVLERIRRWRKDHGFDAVIWRDSPANLFEDMQQGQQTIERAKQWVENHLRGHSENSPEVRCIR